MNDHSVRLDHGYTLIELLVVLLLMGLIGTAMSAGFQFGTRVWERSESTIAKAETQAASQAVLRQLLASATPRMEDGTARFRGEPDHVAFDASPPAAFGKSGLVRVDLSLARDAAGTGLDVKITSLVDGRNSRQVRLTGGLGNVHFAYLDASEKVPVWLGFWRDRPRLPDAVRLESDGTDEGAVWPVFTARLPIAQDALCDFDPVSTNCRTR